MIKDCKALNHQSNPRVLRAQQGEPAAEALYVLVWLQHCLRAHENPVIEAGLAYANAQSLPLLVYHGLRSDYPHASDRLHRFILDASRCLAQGLKNRGIAFVQYVEQPGNKVDGLVYKLADHAAAVFIDDHYAFVGRWQAERFMEKTERTVYLVDASRLVPTRHMPEGLSSTKAFRTAHRPLRDDHVDLPKPIDPAIAPFEGPLPFQPDRLADLSDGQLDTLISACDIDHSLPAPPCFPGTRQAALQRLSDAAETVVQSYKWRRNNPALPHSTSKLSPYLHFGLLDVREIVAAVEEADIPAAARWKFYDELLTWREWSHYQAFLCPTLHKWASLPDWAIKTLEDHASDPRPELQSLDAIVHGETSDPLWNAAQRQWLGGGWMHNNLRMYWSKRLIAFTRTPREAWAIACGLNDSLPLDGRDPATYASMRWAFGEGRRAYKEQPIYGWVAPKSSRALLKRDGMPQWIADMNARSAPRVKLPSLEKWMDLYAP